MKDNFKTVRDDGRLLYEYIRGSHLYGLNNEDSDVDTSGVFILKKEALLGLGMDFQELIADSRNDTTWYEIGKFMSMLTTSNPSVIESLFVPEDKVITKPLLSLCSLTGTSLSRSSASSRLLSTLSIR